jgi:hypothetical protein
LYYGGPQIAVEIKAKSDLDSAHHAQDINYIWSSNIPAGVVLVLVPHYFNLNFYVIRGYRQRTIWQIDKRLFKPSMKFQLLRIISN